MGYTIPEGVDTMLDIVGVGWPNVDEDAYRDMANALREFADDADDDAGAAHAHIQTLLSTGHSESLTALDAHWKKVQGRHKDLAKAARTIAGALDRVADIIVARKIAAVGELADLAATVGITLAMAPVTAGLSTLIAGAKIAVTRAAFKRILKEMADAAVAEIVATLTEPAVAALENIVADLAIQAALTATGVQGGYDVGQTAQAGKEGLQLASAGGGGMGGGPKIDHDAHDRAGLNLTTVQVAMRDKTGSKLGKAKGHHGRAKGRDSLTAVLDTTIDGVMQKLTKALDDMGDHIGKKLPDALRGSSRTHKNTDLDVRDSIKKINDKDAKDIGLGERSSVPGDKRGPSGGDTRTRPASLHGASADPRRHAIPLDKKTCKNDPVDVATGAMVLAQTDVTLPGTLPLTLERTHLSSYRYGQWFGRSWASTLDERMEVHHAAGVLWARSDGSVLVYPHLPTPGGEPVLPLEGPRIPLRHAGVHQDETTYTVQDPETGLRRSFTGSPYWPSRAYWLTEIADRNDNFVTIARLPDGTPTSLVHSGGYTVRVGTSGDRVTSVAVSTPEGPVTVASYGYDPTGNLNAVTNSSGLPLCFAYDDEARIIAWTDRNNSTFRYVYDSAGRVVETVGPEGFLSSTFTYDTTARVTRYTDSTGATTVYRFNDLLQLVAETDPLGNTVTQTWDRHDRLLSRTDSHGRTIRWTWDEQGNLTAVRSPGGAVTTAEYNELGMPTVTVAPNGSTWRREYDDRGNQTALIDPDGGAIRFAYDAHGALISVTDTDGSTETIEPNAAGLPIAQTDPAGNRITFTRDAFGRPVAADAHGAVTTLEWTVEGLPKRRVMPDGSEYLWRYDAEGNCVAETDATGATTSHEYTHFDIPSARVSPDGARYEFTYDTELRLTEVRNSKGKTWKYTYDAVGRVVSETDFDGRTTRYTYDPSGRSATRINPLGQAVTHHFDDDGRLVAKESDGVLTHYTYDAVGRLLAAHSPHTTLAVSRDNRGRITAETVDGRTIRYAYDALGRRTSRVTPTGVTTTFSYDNLGNRTGLDFDGHGMVFAHDALGRERSRSFGPADNPVTLTTTWDGAGRVARQTLAAQGRPVRSRAYAYRSDDRVTSITDLLTGRTRTLDLDPMGRTLRVDAPGWAEAYTYDLEGDQTTAQWPDQGPHPESRGERGYNGTLLERAGSVRYTYDGAGRVIERRKKRLSRKPDIWRYTWDAEDRLTSCTTPDGVLWTYTYDVFGRRTAKRRHAPDGRIDAEVIFTWDNERVVEQTDRATGTTLTWEHDGHRPLAQSEHRDRTGPAADGEAVDRDADHAGDTDSRFFAIITDLIGTPTELVDESGAIAWRSRATQWGATSWNRDAVAYTPLRFPGQYADPETGFHYNFFRHYDPEVGRYVTPDPLGLDPVPNPRGYVAAPSTESDPLGLAPCVDALLDLATQIASLYPENRQRYQTVSAIHAITPKGPRTFVAGTSKSPLTEEQKKLAKKLGLIPIPEEEYLPKPPPHVRGGHAEQNILHFLARRHAANGNESWLPTHGAASRPVCPDICPPVLRASGRLVTVYEPNSDKYKKFYWPDNYEN